MKDRDNKLTDVLKKSFPTQPEKEKQLHAHTMRCLPKRKSNKRTLLFILNCTVTIGVTSLFFIINIKEIIQIIITFTKNILNNTFTDNTYTVILSLLILIISTIWLLYNSLDEYYNNQKIDILEDAMRKRK